MKKDKKWFVDKWTEERDKSAVHDPMYHFINEFITDVKELDEPEALSKEWVNNNVVHVRGLGDIFEEDTVENLLVPKLEELETKILELIESYKQEEDAYSNPENGWISGFIEDSKNLVEEEQKYYVSERDEEYGGFWFLSKNNNGDISIGVNRDWSEVDWDRLKLTEQEIKDYDARYWAFAVKVEELEE